MTAKTAKVNHKHLTAFTVTYTARGQRQTAVILCGKRLTINSRYTNDPDDDHDCPGCAARLKSMHGLVRRPHPMLTGVQALYMTI